jgi:hypothetical protein
VVSAVPFRDSTAEQVADLRARVEGLEEELRKLAREPVREKKPSSVSAALVRMQGVDRLLLAFGLDIAAAWLGGGAYAHWGAGLQWALVPAIVTGVVLAMFTLGCLFTVAP